MDDRTDHLDLPLPHPEHLMIEDVARLREALVSLDAVVSRRAHDSVAIAAGAGLTGGGTLQQSRSLAVAFATQEESEAASVSDVVMSPLRTAQAIAARLASEAEAQAGEAATRLMTPLRTRQVLDGQFLDRLASQADAEAGEEDQRLMTPLRSHQAFDARLATRLATQQQAEAGLDDAQLMTPLRVAQYLAVQPKGEIQRLARTSHIKLTAAEFGRFIDITSGNFTQTFDPLAALGQGWFCYLRNSGTGDITLDPYGSETLDGLTSYVMYPGEVRLVLCDGTALRSLLLTLAPKPMPPASVLRCWMILSRPANAPPQMNSMLRVSTCRNSCCGCLRPPCGGTEATVPSISFNSACCTPSPDTSRVIDGFSLLREILSISSM